MNKPPSTKQIGRPFIKGQVANPKGRPPGLPDRRTRYRELIEARMPELVERCVQLALQGDVQAMRLCFERVLPALKATDDQFAIPVDDATGIGDHARAVVAAVLGGELTPAEARNLMAVLMDQSRILEVESFELRLAALEQSLVAAPSANYVDRQA